MTLWLTAGGVVIALLVGVVGAVVYIDSVKINVAEQAVQLKHLEDGQKELGGSLRSEVARLEAFLEKRLGEIIERLKPPAPETQGKKQAK